MKPQRAPSHQDSFCIRQAQAGDEAAFQLLAERYRMAVYAIAFARTRDRGRRTEKTSEAWRSQGASFSGNF